MRTGDGQAPQPSCGEQDGRGGTGQGGREGGDGRETEPRSKTAGHSGYNGRGTGDRQAPQPSCGEQDGRGRDGTGSENGERDVRRRRMGGIEKSRDVSQHTALSLSRPIRSWTSRIAAFSQMYFRLRDDTHRLDVCKTTKTIKNIKDSISLSV